MKRLSDISTGDCSGHCGRVNKTNMNSQNRSLFASNYVAVHSLTDESQPLEQLLQRCLQSRDDVAWSAFIHRSQPIIAASVIRAICHWTQPRPNLVDDLVQETYLKLCGNDFRPLRQFSPRHENALLGFLKVVASNTTHDHFREAFSLKRGRETLAMQLDSTALSSTTKHLQASMDREILLKTISDCLDRQLGTRVLIRDRVIFWLYYRDGLTARAISRLPRIRLNVKGVESVIWRTVNLIRLTLNGNGSP